MYLRILTSALVFLAILGCGAKKSSVSQKPLVARNDSLMALFNSPSDSTPATPVKQDSSGSISSQKTPSSAIQTIISAKKEAHASMKLTKNQAAANQNSNTIKPSVTKVQTAPMPAPSSTPANSQSQSTTPATNPAPSSKAPDTVGTLEAAIGKNAVISVEKGSAEDKRLDSLMNIAREKSYEYQQYVATHTHTSLAQAAHQDIAKQRRLLLTIAEKAPERLIAAKRAKFMRAQRMREIMGLPPLPDSALDTTATPIRTTP